VTGTAAGFSYDVGFGYDGAFSATARGLVPAGTIAGNVVDDPANDINTALGSGVGITIHPVNVPAGTTYARFALFDDATDGNDDLDLYVFNPSGGFGRQQRLGHVGGGGERRQPGRRHLVRRRARLADRRPGRQLHLVQLDAG
jgi:hypothetical protein